jgi:hypothetical protein
MIASLARKPALLSVALFSLQAAGSPPAQTRDEPVQTRDALVQTRDEPDVQRPLLWLVAAQNPDGSWGADKQSQSPDVATTAIAGLALLRLGHTGTRGDYQANTRRAVEYVAGAVERTPENEIAIQGPGTLPQRKLGRNIDTFMAAQFLAEALPTLPRSLQGRAESALAGCVRRIERAQGKDGRFASDGWAPLLSSAFASSGLHAAARVGVAVDAQKLARADESLLDNYDERSGAFDTRESAGVSLYSVAAGALAARHVQQAPPGSLEAKPEMQRKAQLVEKGAADKLADERTLRGFGSYGGEEHVSYMLTAEAKAALGGADFARFSKEIRRRLAQIQRQDGTWRGDHCITSTTFCTAASLITLAVRPHAGGRPS